MVADPIPVPYARLLPRSKRLLPVIAVLMLFILGLPVSPAGAAETGQAAGRKIVVGGDRDYPPYEFLDKNGQPAGYNVDLTRAIAKVMGMEVEFRLGSWSEMRAALKSGRVDVLQGMSWSGERSSAEVEFSLPHAVVNHAVFARHDSPLVNSLAEMAGKTVAVHRAGIMHDYLVKTGFKGRLKLTDTPADALRLVAAGSADYAVVAIVPGMYLIRELKLNNLLPVVRSVGTWRYCYAVKKGNDELLSRFNEGLSILKNNGEYQAIHNRWLGVLEPAEIPWRQFAKVAAIIGVPLVLLLGGLALWSRTLQRQVALATADLTKEVAERKHAEEELRLNQQQLIQADKMAALGVLVSGVAHEINNPTGLILLEVGNLKRFLADALKVLDGYCRENGDFGCGGLPYSRMREEVPRSLEKLQDSGRRISRIVSDLKDFARQGEGEINTGIDLNAVLRAAVRLVEPSLVKATAHFSEEYAPELPPVRGNAQRIEQVLVNLIINACQALPDRERAIEVRTRHDAARSLIQVQVRDEGAGILPEDLSRLTDPFFTTKRDFGGTGLGLSVSSGIVKAHGGALTFASTPGLGTTVTVTLPVHKEEKS